MPGHLLFVPKTDVVSQDQEKARQELERVAAVLRAVFQGKHPELFRSYFQRLLIVSWGVFLPVGFHAGALSDLAHLKSEVVQRAGGLIKANYNSSLAIAVGWAMAWILSVSVALQLLIAAFASYQFTTESRQFVREFGPATHWDHSISVIHIGVVLAASMVGLLFASMSRNLDPTFDTLMTPDADLMKPWVRLVFFGIAIFVLTLVFLLKGIVVKFGNISTESINTDLLTAILIGLLLGFAERALPSQVERWSKELVNRAGPGN